MGPTVPVMPGPGKPFGAFQADDAECRNFAAGQVAGQAQVANQRAVGGAVLGTVLGAGLGAAVGGGRGAGIGAASGAIVGTGYGANASAYGQGGIQYQYDNAYAQCMYSHGDQVPGFAPPAPAPNYGPAAYNAGGPLVRSVQVELIRLGYMRPPADGRAGPGTSSAISAFESSHGLPVDGVPSDFLLDRLRATPSGY